MKLVRLANLSNQSPRRILITGISGNLGWTLAQILASDFEVFGTFLMDEVRMDRVRCIRLDLRDIGSISPLVNSIKPDVIVHLAAITDPDLCEKNPDDALIVNRDASAEIASSVEGIGAKMIFTSTDLVFDGTKGNYTEKDTPNPLSHYGRSKLEAEDAVLSKSKDALVLRSSLIYGLGNPGRKSFFKVMLESLSQGRQIKVFVDQLRNPILIEDLAYAIRIAMDKRLKGLYHIAGPDTVSRYEFALHVCEQFGYSKDLLLPIRMDEGSLIARRPKNSALDCSLFINATGFVPRSLCDGLSYIANLMRN